MACRITSVQARCHILLTLVALVSAAGALPETRRVDSVKSLTHVLSQVEEDNGDQARFTTMKLQIYLEDVYISQGTAVVLRPARLSAAIGALLEKQMKRSQIARTILRRYQDGEFHE